MRLKKKNLDENLGTYVTPQTINESPPPAHHKTGKLPGIGHKTRTGQRIGITINNCTDKITTVS